MISVLHKHPRMAAGGTFKRKTYGLMGKKMEILKIIF